MPCLRTITWRARLRRKAAGRLAPGQRELLQNALDRLQAGAEVEPERNARRNSRAPYRRIGVPLRVCDPIARPEQRFVLTLELSAIGIGFLTDTPLPGAGGGAATAPAGPARRSRRRKVVHCQSVGGPVHRVGVSFARPITPRRYLDPQAVVFGDETS